MVVTNPKTATIKPANTAVVIAARKLSVLPGFARRRYPSTSKNATGDETANPATATSSEIAIRLNHPSSVFGFLRQRICMLRRV